MKLTDINRTTWEADVLATLLFVIQNDQILLIHKKRGLGAGKINAPGGHIESGETPLEGAIREIQEEVCVTPLNVRKCGDMYFQFTNGLSMRGYVFAASGFEGYLKKQRKQFLFGLQYMLSLMKKCGKMISIGFH